MTLVRRPGRLAAWIAIFAILVAALAPGIARALSAPQQALPWSDICTATGARTAGDGAPQPGSGQHEGIGLKHCPFCVNHAGHFALPTAAPDRLPVLAPDAVFFPPSVTAASPRFIRVATQPRAPPSIS
jgi:hypothetical protein